MLYWRRVCGRTRAPVAAKARIGPLPDVLRPGSEELRQLAARYGLRLVVLFGSRARGERRPDSDFDIAVQMEEPFSRRSSPLTETEAQALRGLHADLQHLLRTGRVDLVLLDRASPLLAHRVARDGIPLFEAAPGVFARFCVRAAQRYDDLRPVLQAERVYLSHAFGTVPSPAPS